MFTNLFHAEGQHQFYLVMELVEGGSLRAYLDNQNRNSHGDVAQFLNTGLTSAIKFIHERGIIHRDTKSCNILLRSDGQPVIADFGIAMHSEQTKKLVVSQGTADYVSETIHLIKTVT